MPLRKKKKNLVKITKDLTEIQKAAIMKTMNKPVKPMKIPLLK